MKRDATPSLPSHAPSALVCSFTQRRRAQPRGIREQTPRSCPELSCLFTGLRTNTTDAARQQALPSMATACSALSLST